MPNRLPLQATILSIYRSHQLAGLSDIECSNLLQDRWDFV